MADGEGFEPPVELPPQRFSRPSQSTALPPILNFIIPPVFQTYGFVRCPHLAVLLTTRSHSTALMLVSLTRMQDRRNRPRLPPILNFYTAGLSNLWFCSLPAPTAWVENFGYYTVSKSDCQFICYADYYTCEPERTCYHYPQRGNIKGHHTW